MSLLRPLSAAFRAAGAIRPSNLTPTFAAANTNLFTAQQHQQHQHQHQHRSKHSATQVKRLFKKNPARLRIARKKGLLPLSKPDIPEPTYAPIFQPTFLGNGWSAPPPPEVEVPEYPFRVGRTGRKPFGAVGFLPVYRDIRIHGTKHTTIIRNISGDVPAFISELRAVLELPLGKKGILTSASTGKHGGGEAGRGVNSENPIRMRTGGAIEVNGDHAREVKRWLAGLGF